MLPDPSLKVNETNVWSDEDSEHEHRLAIVVANLSDRLQRGEPLELHDVCREYPELANDLRSLWGTLVVAHMVGQEESRKDESMPSKVDGDSGG
jgi:serine/threonine-protein kinase